MIPLFKVHSPDDMGSILQRDVFDKGMLTEGEWSDKFEAWVGDFVGNPYTALVNSCTSALALAYRMCGLDDTAKIITSPMTCMATNEPAFNTGAKLVWADINPATGNLSADSVEDRITSNTKAIVMVCWGGDPTGIVDIADVAQRHGIPLITDAAHALGAEYDNKKISMYSDFTCYSFQAIKHLTTGDGGAISCSNKLDFEEIKLLRWFGIDRKYPGSKWEQDIRVSGYKYHMNNINARIGLEQTEYIDDILLRHRNNSKFFDEAIENRPIVKKLERDPRSLSSCWLYSLRVRDPAAFIKHMHGNGIVADSVHVRNDHYAVFREFCHPGLLGLEQFSREMVNIPVGWWLTQSDREKIVDTVNSYGR